MHAKLYHVFVTIRYQRYAGLLWTNPNKPDKIDMKGIEVRTRLLPLCSDWEFTFFPQSVRRDNCQLVKNVINTCLQKILLERNITGAVECVSRSLTLGLHNAIFLLNT